MISGILVNWVAVAKNYNDRKVIFLFRQLFLSRHIVEYCIDLQIYGAQKLKNRVEPR
jgi:hypothetical protein